MNREEAWKELKATIVEIRDNNDEMSTQREICRFLANMMGVLEMQIIEGWIQVSKRLPEYGKEVLTCSNGGFIEIQSLEGGEYWEDQEGFWSDFDEIIAWMPLPESYKAEGEV